MKMSKGLGLCLAVGLMLFGLVGCGEVTELKDKNVDDLYKSVKVGSGNWYQGKVTAEGPKDKLIIRVDLNFKNIQLTNGNVKAIQNIVDSNLAGKYNEKGIDLWIFGEGWNYVNCTKTGDKWITK